MEISRLIRFHVGLDAHCGSPVHEQLKASSPETLEFSIHEQQFVQPEQRLEINRPAGLLNHTA